MNTPSIAEYAAGRTGRVVRCLALAAVLLAGLLLALPGFAQDKPDDNAVWKAFIDWFKSAPLGGDAFSAYAAKLEQEGVPRTEVERRLAAITRLFSERPEGVEVYYDRAFSKPLTGNPALDGPSAPSDFVVETAKGLKPGTALDLGTGRGRNAVYLAGQGWDVTGMDISQAGLNAAKESAAKAGVLIKTVKADYGSFDFGTEQWDLIVMEFAWAPVADPAFVAKIEKSLRPGGIVLFEHFVDDPKHPSYAPMIRAVETSALRDYFPGFEILSFDERERTADWGGPGSRIVRLLARKKSRAPASLLGE
ncbi:MAG TPA: methyltransferase domain-containing protein [Acidobacteriota bacterium]|nr:methyltransferase domain-containing protein [Acidobacteriota bacterium]